MTESNKVGSYGTRQKKWKGKGFKSRKGGNKTNLSGNKRKSEKHAGKQSKNMNCFNYGKPRTLRFYNMKKFDMTRDTNPTCFL